MQMTITNCHSNVYPIYASGEGQFLCMPFMHVSLHAIIIPIYFDFLVHLLLLPLRMPAFNAGVVSRNIGAKETVSVGPTFSLHCRR